MDTSCNATDGKKCCHGCENAQAVMDKHEKIAFQFSGGKDSMACLLFLKPWWDKMHVFWVNTGAAFPEIIHLMEQYKKLLPNFVEVKSNQPDYLEKFGLPADVVPINHTNYGKIITGVSHGTANIYLDCCSANIWQPMQKAMINFGATLIIRGQKNEDGHKAPIRSGDIVDGVEYFFPIQDWTTAEVFEYLDEEGFDQPPFYALHDTSLDCWDCTAYCSHHLDKLAYMKKNHPEKHDALVDKLRQIKAMIEAELSPMYKMLEAA